MNDSNQNIYRNPSSSELSKYNPDVGEFLPQDTRLISPQCFNSYHSFFSAFQLSNKIYYEIDYLRKTTADYVLANKSEFHDIYASYLESKYMEIELYANHIRDPEIRLNKTNHINNNNNFDLEMLALSKALGINIIVLISDGSISKQTLPIADARNTVMIYFDEMANKYFGIQPIDPNKNMEEIINELIAASSKTPTL